MKYCQKEIRIAMIEADVSQVELAERTGYCTHHINLMLRKERISQRMHDLLMNAISEMKAEHRAKAIEDALTCKEVFDYLGSLPRVKKILEDLCGDEETYFDKHTIDEYLDTHDELDIISIADTLKHAMIK